MTITKVKVTLLKEKMRKSENWETHWNRSTIATRVIDVFNEKCTLTIYMGSIEHFSYVLQNHYQ